MCVPLPCDKNCTQAAADICLAEELPEGNCAQLCASMFFENDGSCRVKGGIKKNRNRKQPFKSRVGYKI